MFVRARNITEEKNFLPLLQAAASLMLIAALSLFGVFPPQSAFESEVQTKSTQAQVFEEEMEHRERAGQHLLVNQQLPAKTIPRLGLSHRVTHEVAPLAAWIRFYKTLFYPPPEIRGPPTIAYFRHF